MRDSAYITQQEYHPLWWDGDQSAVLFLWRFPCRISLLREGYEGLSSRILIMVLYSGVSRVPAAFMNFGKTVTVLVEWFTRYIVFIGLLSFDGLFGLSVCRYYLVSGLLLLPSTFNHILARCDLPTVYRFFTKTLQVVVFQRFPL